MIKMLTAPRREVDLENITPDDVSLEVIAHSLARQNRYLGHTHRPYSVAEHSVMVALGVYGETKDPATALWGLLHDAPETWLADIPTPVKILIGADGLARYLEAEMTIMEVVAEKFGLAERAMPGVVHVWDKKMAEAERGMLFRGDWRRPDFPIPRSYSRFGTPFTRCWEEFRSMSGTPGYHEASFLDTFKYLHGARERVTP